MKPICPKLKTASPRPGTINIDDLRHDWLYDVWWQLVSVTELTSFNNNKKKKSPSRDVARQQTLLNVKRNTISSRAWNLSDGRVREGLGGGRLDSFYVELGIVFLFLSKLICASWVFLEPSWSHHRKAFRKKSPLPLHYLKSWAHVASLSSPPTPRRSFRALVGELQTCWRTPELGARGEVRTPRVSLFLLLGPNQDCLALKLSAHRPRSGMWADCASIYTLIR